MHGSKVKTISIALALVMMLVLTVGCQKTKETTTRAQKTPELSGTLTIFHAGSLTVPVDKLTKAFQKEHPNVNFETEAAGSRMTARKVSELKRKADLVMVSDYTVIKSLLMPKFADWNIRFARNAMVIAYTDQSKFADEIGSDNWYNVLLRKDVAYGHSEPNADPCGYRTLMVWQLAEKHYDEPGLYEKLDENCPPKNVRPKETDLIALLESGELDYAFNYRSIAVQHGLNFVELPEEINLSMVKYKDFYKKAKVEISGKKPGKTIIKEGKPIVYGLTIPKNAPNPKLATAFVKFLLGPKGQAIMKRCGQPPIVPAASANVEKLPSELKDMVKPVLAPSSEHLLY